MTDLKQKLVGIKLEPNCISCGGEGSFKDYDTMGCWVRVSCHCGQRAPLNKQGLHSIIDGYLEALEALEFYADKGKWNVREPMKSLGWSPADTAIEALAKAAERLGKL
jgi:hypothetical protein